MDRDLRIRQARAPSARLVPHGKSLPRAIEEAVWCNAPSLDKMPLVINILITAVRNGELDQQLAQTKKPAVLRYLKTA
jgi:hypothetical protein